MASKKKDLKVITVVKKGEATGKPYVRSYIDKSDENLDLCPNCGKRKEYKNKPLCLACYEKSKG